jgi:hypothetical protein
MVKNSNKTYGEIMLEARSKTDRQEVEETNQPLMERFKQIIEDAAQANYDKGVTGKYYIHIWVTKEPYAANTLHIYPQCRRTRPSPYQGNDHYLWSIDGDKVTFEWCIPKKEVVQHVLKNPSKFDPTYVAMLKKYTTGKMDKIEDYMYKGEVI